MTAHRVCEIVNEEGAVFFACLLREEQCRIDARIACEEQHWAGQRVGNTDQGPVDQATLTKKLITQAQFLVFTKLRTGPECG